MQNNPFFKQNLTFGFYKKKFQFAVSQELFSSTEIDKGSQLLLRTLAQVHYKDVQNVLDLGCGYGVIGASLTALYDITRLVLVDRDALAVEFSQYNLKFNKIKDYSVHASLGFDEVPREKFDLIVSNLPGKAGEEVLKDILYSTQYFLSDQGKVAVVVVRPIADFVKKMLLKNKYIELIFEKETSSYTVFHYKFLKSSEFKKYENAFERRVYDRSSVYDSKNNITIKTVNGIPEFDSLNYRTSLMAELLSEARSKVSQKSVIMWNPGQGYIPALLEKLGVQSLVVQSRDILSLQITQSNVHNNTQYHHVHSSKGSFMESDAVIILLEERENLAVISSALADIERGGVIFIAGKASQINQLNQLISKTGRSLELQVQKKSQANRAVLVSII